MTQLILITPKRKIFQLRTPDDRVRCENSGNIYRIVIGQEQNSVLELALATRQLSWRDKRGDRVLVADLLNDVTEEILQKLQQWGEILK